MRSSTILLRNTIIVCMFYIRDTDRFTNPNLFIFSRIENYSTHRLSTCPCNYWTYEYYRKHKWNLANVACFRSFYFITMNSEILRFSVFPFSSNKQENTAGRNMICAFVLLKFLKRNRLFDCRNRKIIYVLYYFRFNNIIQTATVGYKFAKNFWFINA